MLVKGPLGIHLDLRPDYNSRSQLQNALRNALLQAVQKEGLERAKQIAKKACPALSLTGETPEQLAEALLQGLPRAHEVFKPVLVDRKTEPAHEQSTLEELVTSLTSYGSRK
ncbi:MAG: hypothetical protein BWY66_02323 [bacterium ADurb.Bin374]|nr:MAG: hypothetical protein BWY66_02323 [bacterium ADurb.Bin374]